MADISDSSAQVQALLDRLHAGDSSARELLLGQACERLRRLAHKMLKGFARVKRAEETDDILQNALLRLWSALQEVSPRSVPEFYGLASLQIRRELMDLARRYSGPEGARPQQASPDSADGSHSSMRPADDKKGKRGQLAISK